MATYYQQAKQSEKAIKQYHRALEINPDHVLALNNLAMLLSDDVDRLDEAMDLAEKAHRLTVKVNGMPDALIGEVNDTIGWIHTKKGDYGKALEFLSMAVEKSPQNPSVLYHLGVTYQKLNKSDQALNALRKALELSPNFSDAKNAKEMIKQLSRNK